MRLLYTIGILCYRMGIGIAMPFNAKARSWVQGRRGVFSALQETMASGKDEQESVWFHCASLGEFEQGRPVMEQFKERYPRYRLIISFFSPSGYLPRKDFPGAQGVFYLPLDTPANARKWMRIVKPKLVFIIKYEYWFNYLNELYHHNIPTFIVSARFHPGQPFFRWYGAWFREQLNHVSWFFLQDEESKIMIESMGVNRYTITGDTRFDRVMETRNEQPDLPLMDLFKGEDRVIIGGSTWEPEESLLIELIKRPVPNLKIILAPHEVDPERLNALEQRLFSVLEASPPSSLILRLSALNADNARKTRVVIVDSIGLLAKLYRYSTVALIGGAFGKGLHNILEPVAFGNPVLFGPKYDRFHEAQELVKRGGAFPVHDAGEFITRVNALIGDSDELQRVSSICRKYIENGQGATRRILQGLQTLGFVSSPESNRE